MQCDMVGILQWSGKPRGDCDKCSDDSGLANEMKRRGGFVEGDEEGNERREVGKGGRVEMENVEVKVEKVRVGCGGRRREVCLGSGKGSRGVEMVKKLVVEGVTGLWGSCGRIKSM